jgi:hypothetical protein
MNCFCNYAKLVPGTSQAQGVCDGACIATPADVTKIQTWFQGFCGVQAVVTETVTSGSSPTGGSRSGGGGGGDWLSNHWKWVIMLVILVVGIAAIWIGACIWRRRYLKRKDRNLYMGKHSASTVNPQTSFGPGIGNAAHVPYGTGPAGNASTASAARGPKPKSSRSTVSGPGAFMSPAAGTPTPAAAPAMYSEKQPKPIKEKIKEKKKWVVQERT